MQYYNFLWRVGWGLWMIYRCVVRLQEIIVVVSPILFMCYCGANSHRENIGIGI